MIFASALAVVAAILVFASLVEAIRETWGRR